MRDEVLLDYLLQQLSEAETRQLEARLQTDRALAAQLERLRRKIRPLEQERHRVILPPPGLTERTLARLQNLWPRPSRSLPRAPRTLPDWRVTGGRFRPDIFIAGCILILAGGLFLSAMGKLRARHDWLTCQNALRLSYYDHSVQPNALPSSNVTHQAFSTSIEQSLPYTSWLHSEVASSYLPVFLCSLAVGPENTSTSSQPPTAHNLGVYVVYLYERTSPGHTLPPPTQSNTQTQGGRLPLVTSLPTAPYPSTSVSHNVPHPYGWHILYVDGHVQCSTLPRWPTSGTIPRLVHFTSSSLHCAE
jgi:hypothetical protein